MLKIELDVEAWDAKVNQFTPTRVTTGSWNLTNVTKAKLDVNSEQVVAKRLYESLGFKSVSSTLMGLGDGCEHQVIGMELDIA